MKASRLPFFHAAHEQVVVVAGGVVAEGTQLSNP